MVTLRFARDTVAGLFFMAIGGTFVALAGDLELGTATRMAAGYFPRLLGILLMVLGALISLKGSLTPKKKREPLYQFDLKRLFILCVAVLAFAATLQFGLLIAMSLMVGIACLANDRPSLKETLTLIVAINTIIAIIFIGALDLEIALLPSWGGA